MVTIEQCRNDLKEKYEKDLARLKNYEPVFDLTDSIIKIFNGIPYPGWTEARNITDKRFVELTVAFGSWTINCLSFNLYLAETDNIKSASEVLSFMMDHKDFKFEQESDYPEAHWRGWKFIHIPTKEPIMVRVFFERSNSCKIVPTGKMKEEFAIVCSN